MSRSARCVTTQVLRSGPRMFTRRFRQTGTDNIAFIRRRCRSGIDFEIMTHLRRSLIVLSILMICSQPLSAEETEEGALEATSPDGQFAFRYTKDSKSNPDSDSESE